MKARTISFASLLLAAGLLAIGCGTTAGTGTGDATDTGLLDLAYGENSPGDAPVTPETAGETVGPNDPGPGETGPAVNPSFPSGELLLKITEPSGSGGVAVIGGTISLSGMVLGKVGAVSWIALGSGATGAALVAAPFWTTDAIPLTPGDNFITVHATGNGETVEESILVTYNPTFLFQAAPKVLPAAVFTDETQAVHVTIALGPFGSIAAGVTLQQVSPTGALLTDLGPLVDDGQVGTSGDEISHDGVYTKQVDLTCVAGGSVYLRAAAQAKGFDGQLYSALSPIVRLDCVGRLSPAACTSHQATLSAAQTAYGAALAGGVAAARQAAIAAMTADPDAREVAAASDPGGLWMAWKDGLLGALPTAEPGLRGGGGPAGAPFGDALPFASPAPFPIPSRDVLLLSPFASVFGADDETQFLGNLAASIDCPPYRVLGPYNDATASLARFRAMSDSGIVAIATHGDAYFHGLSAGFKQSVGWVHPGSQEVLWSGEAVNCAKLTTTTKSCSSDADCPSGTTCEITKASFAGGTAAMTGSCVDATQVDAMAGRLVMSPATWGITPEFVHWYGTKKPYPGSLVYLGACRSMYNGTLASAFFSSGALAVAGYGGPVSSAFAGTQGKNFFNALLSLQASAGTATGLGVQDPAHPGSVFQLFGARSLTAPDSALLNPSFETPGLSGWEISGDGRAITQLGTAAPVQGKQMAILSTGLGFTTQLGAIEQAFCIPAGLTSMSFYWKFYSEEFHEYCGSAYQDTFTATLTDKFGKESKVAYANVDAMCCANDCTGCGTYWKGKACGLTPSDVQFDQNDTHKTGWQKTTYNVANLAGQGPVTLKFFCTDKGDSIYDTAVLVDAIEFQ